MNPGDRVTVSVSKNSRGKWTCAVTDQTAHASSTATLNYDYSGETRHADFIVEHTGGTAAPLAAFGTVTFTHLHMNPTARFNDPKDRYVLVSDKSSGGQILAFATLDPLVVHYDVKTASAAAATLSWSAPTTFDTSGGVTSVSCASTSFCAATDGSGNILTYDGSSWRVGQTSDDQLNSVSCATTTSCLAVGYDSGGGNVFTYANGSWSSPQSLDVGYKLHSISCPSPTFCAVGAAVNVFTVQGSDESGPEAIDQSNNQTNESGYGLPSMSCTSTTSCVTIDGSGNAFVLRGSTWSQPETIDSGVQLNAVSCSTPGFCVAVDNNGDALTFNGTWSRPQSVVNGTSLNSISCVSSRFCVAVDGEGHAITFNGTTWGQATPIDAGHSLVAISCPTTTFCLAVTDDGEGVIGR